MALTVASGARTRTVLNEPGPADVCLHILSFSPATTRVFLSVSRVLKQLVEEHLDATREEIFNFPNRSDVHPLVDQRIRHYYFRSMEQNGHSSGYNALWFHASVQRELLALGAPFEGSPDSIPAPGEICSFNRSQVQVVQDHNLQKIWGPVRHEIAQLNPVPGDLPANDAPAHVLRAWMQAHQTRLQEITLLDLHGLDLTSVPIEISLFTGLTVLRLNNNKLRALSEGVFQGLERLLWLDLYVNQLTSLPEEIFQGLRLLASLNLLGNQLTSLPESVFQEVGQLQHLSLGDNQLTFLPERIFQGLELLENLILIGNRLTTLPRGLLQWQSQLVKLELDNNQLRSLPEELFARGKLLLRFLYLRHNQLLSLPERLFEGLDRLETLYIHHNPELLISWLDPDSYINNIDFKIQMHEFFGYRCQSSLAEFYQLVAGDASPEVVRRRFEDLDVTIRNAIFGRIGVEAEGDAHWGELHAFDDMQRFKRALKRYVKTRWKAEGTMFYDINVLARIDAMCRRP